MLKRYGQQMGGGGIGVSLRGTKTGQKRGKSKIKAMREDEKELADERGWRERERERERLYIYTCIKLEFGC